MAAQPAPAAPYLNWATEEIDDPHNLIHGFFSMIEDGSATDLLRLLDYITDKKAAAAGVNLDKLTLGDSDCVQARDDKNLGGSPDWAAVPGPKELGKVLMPDATGQKMTGLMVAAKDGSVEVAKMILERCEPDLGQVGTVIIEGHTIEGASALWCAAGAGHLPVVELLVDAGADVNQT